MCNMLSLQGGGWVCVWGGFGGEGEGEGEGVKGGLGVGGGLRQPGGAGTWGLSHAHPLAYMPQEAPLSPPPPPHLPLPALMQPQNALPAEAVSGTGRTGGVGRLAASPATLPQSHEPLSAWLPVWVW